MRFGVQELHLIVTLPAEKSEQTRFIQSSFKSELTRWPCESPRVDLSQSIYRNEFSEPVTAYIISNSLTGTRTIVNYNELPEMTWPEFSRMTEPLLLKDPLSMDQIWVHFEGRIPETTLRCIQELRQYIIFHQGGRGLRLKVSVELEKPGREGLQDLACAADVVFYSKAWARGEGYQSAEDCLKQQVQLFTAAQNDGTPSEKTLICTWGEQGAAATSWSRDEPSGVRGSEHEIAHIPAYAPYDQKIIDTTGAGDTFIAGVLFGLICRASNRQPGTKVWTLARTLAFANGLAGRKILQSGLQGLGPVSRELRMTLDSESA